MRRSSTTEATTAETFDTPAQDAPVTRDLAAFTMLVVAGLSAASGGIHGAAMPEHAREHWLFGIFFAGSAAFQVVWAFLALRRPTPGLFRAGAAANAAFIALWFVTRTTGVPVGPQAWTAEPVGFVDAVTVAFEAALVVMSLRLARPGAIAALEGRPIPGTFYALAAASAAVAVAALARARTHARESLMTPADDHARTLWVALAGFGLLYALTLLRRARNLRRSPAA